MSTTGPETKLAVVLKDAVADDHVLAREGRPTGVGVLEGAILDGDVIAGELSRTLLGPIRRIAEAKPFDDDVAASNSQNLVAGGGLHHGLVLGNLLVVGGLDVETLSVEIDEERAPAELVAFEHLAERVTIDEDLLTAPDQAMVIIVRMGVGLVPRDEFVRPGRAVNPVGAWN